MQPLLSIRNLHFAYGETPVLRGASLDLAPRDFAVLRGESGCGKSTLLRLIARLEAPREGSMYLDGVPYADIPGARLRRRLALLQQLPVMLPGSVRDNLLLSLRFDPDHTPPPADAALRDMLDRARLGGLELDAQADALSVGQKQRIALLRLLVMRPDALLLDEPTAALDPESAGLVLDMLRDLHRREPCAMLLVSHGAVDALPAGARLLRMHEGAVEEDAA